MMECIGLLSGISTLDCESFEEYVNSFHSQKCFFATNATTKALDETVKSISSLLIKKQTRRNGLILLNWFIEQCPQEVLETKLNFWIVEILKCCAFGSKDVVNCACDVLSKIATKARGIPTFGSNHLPKIYETLIAVLPDYHISALRCIEVCLRNYPGPSAPSRTVIERHLHKFVDSHNRQLSCCVAKCQLALQQVRGGSAQGVSQKCMWEKYQLQLLNSLNIVLDKLFEKCTELYENGSITSHGELNVNELKLSDDPIRRVEQLCNRFSNLIIYLMTALCEHFPVEKPVKPKQILNLISRGLSMNSHILHSTGVFDNLVTASLLPKLHLQLIQLLYAFLLSIGSHAKLFHVTIIGILNEALKISTYKSTEDTFKKFHLLRMKVYEVISLFCSTVPNSCGTIFAEAVIVEIFKDITPNEKTLSLNVTMKNGVGHTGQSKKAKRQMQKTHNEQSNIAKQYSTTAWKEHNVSQIADRRCCVVALKCLQEIINSTAHCLTLVTLKVLQLKLVQIYGLFYDLPMQQEDLYFDSNNRKALYNVLWSLYSAPANRYPFPPQIMAGICQHAHYYDNYEPIREQCRIYLQYLEKTIHPSKEKLSFPLNIAKINRDISEMTPIDVDVDDDIREMHVSFNNSSNLRETSLEENTIEMKKTEMIEKDSTPQPVDKIETISNEISALTPKTTEPNEALNVIEHDDFISCETDRDSLLQPPANKKLKLNTKNSNIIEQTTVPIDKMKPEVVEEDNDDDDLLGDIAADFVNELN